MADRVIAELTRPADADSAEAAHEAVRAWIIDRRLQCSVNPSLFTDRGEWGTLLADMAQHIAGAIEEVHGTPAAETLALVAERFGRALAGE